MQTADPGPIRPHAEPGERRIGPGSCVGGLPAGMDAGSVGQPYLQVSQLATLRPAGPSLSRAVKRLSVFFNGGIQRGYTPVGRVFSRVGWGMGKGVLPLALGVFASIKGGGRRRRRSRGPKARREGRGWGRPCEPHRAHSTPRSGDGESVRFFSGRVGRYAPRPAYSPARGPGWGGPTSATTQSRPYPAEALHYDHKTTRERSGFVMLKTYRCEADARSS